MRSYGSATSAALAARTGLSINALLWITATNRSTGAAETIGFWDGADNETFTIGGVNRIYYGAGSLIGIDAIIMTSGLNVQMQGITLSAISPEAEQAIRGYDMRLAPVEIHRAFFDPLSGNLLEEPTQMFTGWCDTLPLTRSAQGGPFTGKMNIASSSRSLTRNLGATKSDASLRERSSTDAFRQYASIVKAVPYYWGSHGPQATAVGQVMALPPTIGVQ